MAGAQWTPRFGLLALAALAAAGLALCWAWDALPWPQHAQSVTHAARAASPACPLPEALPTAPQPGLVWVPGGTFTLGDSVYPEERPAGPSTVQGFWMDRTEVTNAQFAEFVRATGHVSVAERALDPARHPQGEAGALLQAGALVFQPPRQIPPHADPTHWWRYVPGAQWRHPGGPGTDIQGREQAPVVAVTYADALAYARWRGRDLPTEAEWEWAARAASTAPMPSHEQPREANTWQGRFPVRDEGSDGHIGVAPVGCHAPNALGLFDMIGNVWELTRDPFHLHGQAPLVPTSPRRTVTQRVIKGGSFLCSPDYCMRYRPGSRQPQDEDLGTSHVGFRTVLRATGPQRSPP